MYAILKVAMLCALLVCCVLCRSLYPSFYLCLLLPSSVSCFLTVLSFVYVECVFLVFLISADIVQVYHGWLALMRL